MLKIPLENGSGAIDEVAKRVFKIMREPHDNPPALAALLLVVDGDDVVTCASGERIYVSPLLTIMPQLLAMMLIARTHGRNEGDGPTMLTHGHPAEVGEIYEKHARSLFKHFESAKALMQELDGFSLLLAHQQVTGWPRGSWPLFWIHSPTTDPKELWKQLNRHGKAMQGKLNAVWLDGLDWVRPNCQTIPAAVNLRLREQGAGDIVEENVN